MELEWESRPTPHHPPSDWHDRSQAPLSFAPGPPPPPFASGSSLLAQRRRSSAAHVRPAAPPPNLPIPSLPSANGPAPRLSSDPPQSFPDTHSFPNGSDRATFARPAASPNLNGSQPFPTSAFASSSLGSSVSSPTAEDLSDPPPRSFLPQSARPINHQQQELAPNPVLLAPPDNSRAEHRPSSRRALTRALELARQAVQLDSTNDNPEAAVNAYAQSVALLSEVMDRVRRGEESTETNRRRRRRSVAAQEEEVRRLQNIHDTYADRMNILSIIYSIPAVPYSTSSIYSSMTMSTDSTTSNSPTTSTSPSSDNSPQLPQQSYASDQYQSDSQIYPDNYLYSKGDYDDSQLTGAAVTLDESLLAGSSIAGFPPASTHHPYAVPYNASSNPSHPITITPPRNSTTARRPRASSALPPPPPPPLNALPPAPVSGLPELAPDPPSLQTMLESQPRGTSIGHRRTGSGLAALEEETDDVPEEHRLGVDGRIGTLRPGKRDSHPLPPLPSPALSSADSSSGTPRTNVPISKPPPSPRLVDSIVSRPRGTSQLTTRAELAKQPHMINPTTTQGTIYQRRSTKSSASSSPRPSSPAESTASASSITQSKPMSHSLPAVSNGAMGRSRSSSQPSRRTSLVGGRVSPPDALPPLPSPGLNGANAVLRKSSFPSKLAPSPNIPNGLPLSVSTDMLSPTPVPIMPSPSAFPGNLPTTPTSPMPPAPPTDPLRKPYHMMNLLRNTMTYSTGGYVTRRLHVPFEVWSQGGAKLTNVVEKVRVVGILCSALEDLQTCSVDYFGAGSVSSGLGLGIGSIGRKEADAWLAKLEEFSNVCDGVVANFGKKLGVGEGFVLKKTTWGDKLTRRFDKLTNGKNLDSPAAYVQGLKKLFLHAQLLDEHTRAVLAQPVAPAYAAFPVDMKSSAEQKLKRSSEFFASVVLTFVIRDLSQLLDKYAKKCEKWLAE